MVLGPYSKFQAFIDGFLISLVNLSIRHLQMIVFPTPNSMVFLFHRVGTTQDSDFVYAFEFFIASLVWAFLALLGIGA